VQKTVSCRTTPTRLPARPSGHRILVRRCISPQRRGNGEGSQSREYTRDQSVIRGLRTAGAPSQTSQWKRERLGTVQRPGANVVNPAPGPWVRPHRDHPAFYDPPPLWVTGQNPPGCETEPHGDGGRRQWPRPATAKTSPATTTFRAPRPDRHLQTATARWPPRRDGLETRPRHPATEHGPAGPGGRTPPTRMHAEGAVIGTGG